MARKRDPELQKIADDFAAGRQFMHDVNAEYQAMGVAVDSPEWFDYCTRMEAWQTAVADGSP